MQLCFLADANLDQDIVAGLLRREPSIDFELPQSVLADGTGDPVVLAIAASLGRILVTHDIRTMPFHFAEFVLHSASPGLILVPQNMQIKSVIDELLLIWLVSDGEYWRNRYRRLPI